MFKILLAEEIKAYHQRVVLDFLFQYSDNTTYDTVRYPRTAAVCPTLVSSVGLLSLERSGLSAAVLLSA